MAKAEINRKLRRVVVRLTLTLGALFVAASPSHAALPAVKSLTGTPISPSSAASYYGSGTTHTAGLCSLNSTLCSLPPDIPIVELARSLSLGKTPGTSGAISVNQYALNVFEYIYKNVDTEFRYGLSKGAFGALIDQSGTPFDQAALMVALLRYKGITASYYAGTATLTGAQFQAWTGITNTAAACQLLANGGIPLAFSGTTPSSCSGLTGSVSSITISHIWVSANGNLYDPSFKSYLQKTGIANLPSAMGCYSGGVSTCGATALASAIPSGSTYQGYDSTAAANYVQNVQYSALGGTLNGFATNLEHYIQANLPSGSVQDIVGGQSIDPTSMPTPGATLPYATGGSPLSWTGDIPDQYRSRLGVFVDNISVWLYADETYGYWLHLGAASGNTAPGDSTGGNPNRSYSLLFEREWGTAIGATPNLTYNYSASGSTNQIVPLQNSTIASGSGVTTLTLQADHPYAASSGTYGDDTFVSPILSLFPTFIIQAWGRTGRGRQQRDSAMSANKQNVSGNSYDRNISGSALALPSSSYYYYEDLMTNLATPGIASEWLSQAGAGLKLLDGMAGTRTVEQHSLGIVNDGIDTAPGLTTNAGSSISIVSTTMNTAVQANTFQTAATIYDLFEGGSNEEIQDTPDGGNSLRWFQMTNTTGNRFYQTTPTNMTSVLAATSGYTGAPEFGLVNPTTFIESYLGSTGPTFDMIVPKVGTVGSFTYGSSTITYYYGPLLAYATDGSQLAYVVSDGAKGAGVAPGQYDPLGTTIQSATLAKPTLPFKFDVDGYSGATTVTPTPDIVDGAGSFPTSLSYQRFYSSSNVSTPECHLMNEGGLGTYTLCGVPDERRLVNGWTDNLQIDAAFSNDGFRALGSDSGVEASALIAAIVTIQDLGSSPGFQHYVTSTFTASWAMDQMGANAIVIDRPPTSETFVKLPDGFFNPRPGSQGTVTYTGGRARESFGNGWVYGYGSTTISYTGAHGDTMSFDNYVSTIVSPGGIINQYKPDNWIFPNGIKLTFNYSSPSCGDPVLDYCKYQLSGVSNSLGRALTYTSIYSGTPDSEGYYPTYSITDESSRNITVSDKWDTYNSDQPTAYKFILPDTSQFLATQNEVDDAGDGGYPSERVTGLYVPSSHASPYLSLSWDTLYRAQSITDANSNLTGYFPASVGVRESNARGEFVDPLNNATVNYFDLFAHNLSSTDPLGRTTTKSYDDLDRLILTTYPVGNSTALTYDIRSNTLTSTQHQPSGCVSSCTITTSSAFEEGPTVVNCVNWVICNEPLSTTDGNGYTTKYTWDSALGVLDAASAGYNTGGSTCLIHDALGVTDCPTTTYGYSAFTIGTVTVHLLTSKTQNISSTVNTITQYDYNTSNKYVLLDGIVDPTGLNLKTSLTFDSVGNVTQINNPRYNAGSNTNDFTNYTWDANRRLIFSIGETPTTGASKIASKYTYDVDGDLIETDRGNTTSTTGSGFSAIYTVDNSYDAIGNKIEESEITSPSAVTNITQYSYDADNRLQCTGVRMNASVFGSLPTSACTLSTTGSYGPDRITEEIYDAASQKVQEIRAYATALQEAYATYTYTPNGKQATVTDALGTAPTTASGCSPTATAHVTFFCYDGFDRLQITTFPDGTNEQLAYDSDNNILTRENRSGQTITYTYDGVDRLATKAVPAVAGVSAANTVTWTYDLKDEVAKIADTLGNTLTNVHDLAGRVTSAGRVAPGLTGAQTISYSYDQDGNRTVLEWPDGFEAGYCYDAMSRMTGADYNASGSPDLTCGTTQPADLLATYQYDALGRRSQVQYGALSGSSQLGASVGLSWSPAGDLSMLSHTFASGSSSSDVAYTNVFNPAHQIASSSNTNTNYEIVPLTASNSYAVANGLNQYPAVAGSSFNYDTRGNLTSDGSFTYGYDPENNLMTASGASLAASYAYDPLNRRTQKSGTGVTQTFFLDDGNNEIAEYNGTGGIQRRFVPGSAPNDFVAEVTSGGTVAYFHDDKAGSTIAMSSATGVPTEGPYLYDPFGNGGPITGVPFKFTGQYLDAETGLYFDRARYYSASLGRFYQTDPVGYTEDLNLYTYVGNDPTDKVDPTGRDVNCDTNGQCTVRADTFDASKSKGQNLQNTPAMDKSMVEHAGDVQSSGDHEKVIGVNKDGSVVKPTSSDASGNAARDSNTSTFSSHVDGILHGHLDGKSDGMVDETKGLGDSQPLTRGSTNGTESNGRVGVRELVNGRLQERMLKGRLDTSRGEFGQPSELQKIQNNLNDQQSYFQQP